MSLRHQKKKLLHHIVSPVVQPNVIFPLCQTCGRYCDSMDLVDGYPGEEDEEGCITVMAGSDSFTVLVKHHGAEERVTFNQDGRLWGPSDIRKFVMRHEWFSPFSGHLGT